ncbi:MAG: MBOAT family protein [Candidatus Kaiserbacteria bacterium]|nr:MBOAT family protein [Candidatus Kaiserbacteria bacterium]
MLFDSLSFVVFFIAIFFLYFTVPARWQKWLLLAASCYFYMAFVPQYILVLFFLITIDYFLGIKMERSSGRIRMWYLIVSIASNVGMLFFFKYFNFFNQNIGALAQAIHWNYSIESLAIILPLGLSFHTFQSLAYIIEVYKGRFAAERNYGVYALYVMFFPQLVAGPIERPAHLLPQLSIAHSFAYDNAVSGLKTMLWGFFKKIVIANNLAIAVDFIYAHLATSNGSVALFAVFAFAIVLYADFSGYSDIAVGSARMLGIELTQNFRRPYFSQSIAELWRRWHISLSSWFRDYVYSPLVWKWRDHGIWWTYGAVVITFLLTGVWHGAGWNFVMMGLLFGLFICVGLLTKSFREKMWAIAGIGPRNVVKIFVEVGSTFILTSLAWVFFRAQDLSQALLVLERIFTQWGSDAFSYLTCSNYCAAYAIGISRTTLAITGISVALLFACELFKELRLDVPKLWYHRAVRWSLYYVFILWMLFAGYFAPMTFIYFKF